MWRRGIGHRSAFCRSVEDYIDDENPVRVIDAFVDSLDMEALGFQKAKPAQTGRPAYDPRDLLKLYLYGYLNRIRSSRMFERNQILTRWRILTFLSGYGFKSHRLDPFRSPL